MPAGAICRGDNPRYDRQQRPAGAQAQACGHDGHHRRHEASASKHEDPVAAPMKVSAKKYQCRFMQRSERRPATMAPTAPTTLATEAMAPIDTRFVTPRFLMRVGNQKPQA